MLIHYHVFCYVLLPRPTIDEVIRTTHNALDAYHRKLRSAFHFSTPSLFKASRALCVVRITSLIVGLGNGMYLTPTNSSSVVNFSVERL